MDALSESIVSVARALPPAHIERLARAIDDLPAASRAASAMIEAAAAGGEARAHAETLATAWEAAPGVSAAALAFALRCAAAAAVAERGQETLDVVWTGPATPAVPVRRTAAVLLDLIAGARQELLAVSFAAYRVPAVLEALGTATARGVDVRLVLESAAESGGALTVDAKEAFASLEGQVSFYSWPLAQRGDGPRGTLHAKAVVADGERALVTSANLTGSALDVNMELGLLVDGGAIPRRLMDHFRELIARGVLLRIG